MRSILLLAVLLFSAQIAKADPVVIGPGSALMSMPVASCTWSQGCGWGFEIQNTGNFAVNGLSFGVYDLSPLSCFIPANSSQTFFVLVSNLQGTSAIDLYNNTFIHTGASLGQVVATPEPATLLLLGTGISLLAAGRRRRRS